MRRLLKYIGSMYNKRIRTFINSLLVPKGYIVSRIDRGQLFVFNPSDSAQGYAYYVTGLYGDLNELIVQQIFQNLVENKRYIVDAGAHYGFYTLIAAVRISKSGKVLAFEPSKDNFRVLKLNIVINRLQNVKLFNVGLWDHETEAYLGMPKGTRNTGEKTLAINVNQSDDIEIIKLKRLDTILNNLNINRVNLAKIDVEGAEYHVIKGFGTYLDECENIIIEVHPRKMLKLGYSPIELYNMLKKHGFEVYLIDRRKIIVPINIENIKRISRTAARYHVFASRLDSEYVLRIVLSTTRWYNLTSLSFFDKRHRLTVSLNKFLNKTITTLRGRNNMLALVPTRLM